MFHHFTNVNELCNDDNFSPVRTKLFGDLCDELEAHNLVEDDMLDPNVISV